MNKLLTILLLWSALANAQSTQRDSVVLVSGFNTNIYYHRPADYDSDPTKSRPLIIFFPGAGELVGPVTNLNVYGPSYFMNAGDPMEFAIADSTVKPYVVSMQVAEFYPGNSFIDAAVETCISLFPNVDRERVYLTGLSRGAQFVTMYVSSSPTAAQKIAAVWLMHAQAPDGDGVNQMGNTYARNGGKWWGIEGQDDYRYMDITADTMNAVVPGSAKYTLITTGNTGSTHCCWNTFYDPAYTVASENGYQFLLKQRAASYLPPSANAGTDQKIFYPASSISLTGSGFSLGSIIVSYAWTKEAGPNTPSASGANTATVSLTGMIPGLYRYRLTVTDGEDATAYDDVNVLVSNGISTNKITVRTDMLWDGSGFKDKSIRGLFDNDLDTRIDLDQIGEPRVLPFRSFILLDSVYTNIGIAHYDAFANAGGLDIKTYDSSRNLLNTYRMIKAGGWDTVDLSADVNIHFIEVQALTSGDLAAGIYEFHLYGTAVARVSPIVIPETILPFADLGKHGHGIGGKDDIMRIHDYVTGDSIVPNMAGTYRAYLEGNRYDYYPSGYEDPLDEIQVDQARFGYGHIDDRMIEFGKRQDVDIQIVHTGGNLKNFTEEQAETSNNNYGADVANQFKYIVPGADSTQLSVWNGLEALYMAMAGMYGTNEGAATYLATRNITGGSTVAGRGGGHVSLQKGNEYNRNYGAITGYHSPLVYLQLLKGTHDGVKSVDPNMKQYAAAWTYFDTTYAKSMVWWNYFLYGRQPFPADGFCANVYTNTPWYDGQPPNGKALSPERFKLLPRFNNAKTSIFDKYLPNRPLIVTEFGYATSSGSQFYAEPIGSKTSEEVAADLALRFKQLAAASPLNIAAVYYALFGDGSGPFNSMAASKSKFNPSYIGDSLYLVGRVLTQQFAIEKAFNYRNIVIQDGDSTGAYVMRKDHPTDPTKKLFIIWNGTQNGSVTEDLNVNVGMNALSVTRYTVNYSSTVASSSSESIVDGGVIMDAEERMQWLLVNYPATTINTFRNILGSFKYKN